MQSIYCPNPKCPQSGKNGPHLIKAGTYRRKESVQEIQRYRCKVCQQRFSQRLFTLNYRNRFDFINQSIMDGLLHGASNSAIGRLLKVSETTIRRRIKRLAEASFHWMNPFMEKAKIQEAIVYDGFESFTESQYFPFHLNFCIGQKSHFIFNFNFTPLNRKGRMTKAQKKKREKIYQKRGKFEGNLLEKKTHALFEWCEQKAPQGLHLLTDEHKTYERALKRVSTNKNIQHIQINSKVKRDVHNILFPANSLDMQLRHFLACFKRETIAFCKTPKAAMFKTIIFTLHKNFMRTIFLKKKPGWIESEISAAMKIGVAQKIYTFEDVFNRIHPLKTKRENFNEVHQWDTVFC